MKFPITRETLQAFDITKERAEQYEEDIEKHLTLILDQLCTEFKQNINGNIQSKQFVWRNIRLLISMRTTDGIVAQPNQKDILISKFIEKLKGCFIGCNVIVDPLKTYIIIDWS